MAEPCDRVRVVEGERADPVAALDLGVGRVELVDRDVRVGHRGVRDLGGAQGGDLGARGVQQRERAGRRLVGDDLAGGGESAFQAVAVGEHERGVARLRAGRTDHGARAVAQRHGPGEVDRLDGGLGGGLGGGGRCGDGGCRARGGEQQGTDGAECADEGLLHVGVPFLGVPDDEGASFVMRIVDGVAVNGQVDKRSWAGVPCRRRCPHSTGGAPLRGRPVVALTHG